MNPLDTSTATEANESVALGDLLRSSRERRGMSLQQIAAETRIPLRHLQALERDDFKVVPAGIYRRAEIRAYARALHFDQDAIAQLERVLRSTEPPPAPAVAPDVVGDDETTPLQKSVLMALAAVGAVLLLGWAMRGGEDSVPGTPQPKSPVRPAVFQQQRTPTEEEQAGTTPEPDTPGDSAVATVGSPAPAPTSTKAGSDATVGSPEPPLAATSTTADSEARVVQPQTTELLITSDPPGARVTVDGIGWGFTPVTIRHLPPGTKHIRVTKEGYDSEEHEARVAGDRPSEIHVSLRAVP